jgi:hypothetical protein
MQICAGFAKNARVLVPFSPELRWTNAGSRSPWVPGFQLGRQPACRDWQPVLDSLVQM